MYHLLNQSKLTKMIKSSSDLFRNNDVLLRRISSYEWCEFCYEEFFHTFSALLDKGSQIVLTADRSPSKLKVGRIQERIKSRFFRGLVVDICNPDLDLRSAIKQIK